MFISNSYLSLAQMKVNAQYILDYLLAKGWTKNAVCGMLGNMQTESTINPGIWEGLQEGDLNDGVGLVQWTPATKYLWWADSEGLQRLNMESQLKRILWEVENDEQWIWSSMTFTEFTQSSLPAYDLGMLFIKAYERPYDVNQPIRGTQAEYWFSELSGESSCGRGGDEGLDDGRVETLVSVNGSISKTDVYLSVRCEEKDAERMIFIIKRTLGLACKRMELA